MEIPITTPALLFPAIAIMMLGYINRYVSTAGVIRNYKKDHQSGVTRHDIERQLGVLRKRIELSRYMMTCAASGLFMACISTLLIFFEQNDAGAIAFGGSLVLMTISLVLSIIETTMSNKSLLMEIDSIIKN